MGGVCDTEFTTETPKEMMKIAGDHVMAATDPEHMKVKSMMEESMKNKEMADVWEKDFLMKWEAKPAN